MTKTRNRVHRPDSANLAGGSPISFERWKFSIQTAMDFDQLMLVVSAYLSGWSKEELLYLPPLMGQPITSLEDLMARAVDASRAAVNFKGPEDHYRLQGEMAATLAFAASRLRYLQAIQSSRASSGPSKFTS